MGLEPDEGVFDRLEEEANEVDWSLDDSTGDVPGSRGPLPLGGIVVPSGPVIIMDGLWTEASEGEPFCEGFGGDVESAEAGGRWPFSLTFPGTTSGESASASLSLSLPPFLGFFERDWLWPIARLWWGAWGEPGVGWDLLLPERREVRAERIVGASLETFPSRSAGSIDGEVTAVASNVKQLGILLA